MILSNTSRAVQKLVRSPQFAQARGQAPRIYLTKMAAGQLFDDLYQVAWDMGNLLAAQRRWTLLLWLKWLLIMPGRVIWVRLYTARHCGLIRALKIMCA